MVLSQGAKVTRLFPIQRKGFIGMGASVIRHELGPFTQFYSSPVVFAFLVCRLRRTGQVV